MTRSLTFCAVCAFAVSSTLASAQAVGGTLPAITVGGPALSTLVLASSTAGSQTTLTATLLPLSSLGHLTDGEVVTFRDASTQAVLASATLVSGVAAATVAAASVNTYLYATYPGDTFFSRAASLVMEPTLVTTMNLDASTTAGLTTYTATLYPFQDGDASSNGVTVTFLGDGNPVGVGVLLNGVATLKIPTPGLKVCVLVSFPGTANLTAATSNCANTGFVASQADTSLGLSFTNSGGQTTYKASLYPYTNASGSTDGGIVTVRVNGNAIGTANLTNGAAVVTIPTSAPGDYVWATYPGNASFTDATSNLVLPGGNAGRTACSVGINSSSLIASVGTTNIIKASLYPYTTAEGGSSNNESITFVNQNGATLGSAVLTNGVATLDTSAFLAGTITLQGIFNGDVGLSACASAQINQTFR